MYRSAACVSAFLISAVSSAAQDYSIPLKRTEDVSGVSVNFDAVIKYSIPRNGCEPIPLKLTVSLKDLSDKLLPIIKATGIERRRKCGRTLSIEGAGLSADKGNFNAKIRGKVASCFRVLGKRKRIRSNATMSASFAPVIANNTLTAKLVGRPTVHISNDVIRALADLFRVDNKVERKLADSIQKALSKPQSALQLPAEVAGFQFQFKSARAETIKGLPSLVVEGQAPRRQPVMDKFFGYLGVAAGQPVTAAQCQ